MTRTITFRSGRLPAQPARPQLRLEDHVTADLPAPPSAMDWQQPVDKTGWPMYLNDRVGDCTFAEVGHHVELITGNAAGTAVEVTDDDVLKGYEAVSGYVPGDQATDTGCYIADVMAYWHKTGVGGHRILAYASIHPANTTLVKQAIALFGGVSVGLTVSQANEDQFNAGRPWDYVKGSRSLGGHCILIGAYGPSKWRGVTWGAEQDITPAFYQHQVNEIWVPVTDEWFKDGKSPQGIDAASLGAAYTALTGQPNPFPVTPQPTPTPVPTPVPADADHALAAAIDVWRAAKKV
jgi:hypothetical protein